MKPRPAAEISSKRSPPCKILRTILKLAKGRTQTNGQ